ncbi:hypothetical protein GCM10027203_15700 [Nonomuraea fastidiosa]
MLALAARLPPISSRTWLPESATEWMPSASIDEEPVKNAATNLDTAIAKFADNAAMIAFVPPLALTDLLHS